MDWIRNRPEQDTLEAIVNAGPAIVFRWDLGQGWPVIFVSDNISQLGFQPDDFYSGQTEYADLIYPEDLSAIAREIQYNLDHHINEFVQQYRIKTVDNSVRWIKDWTKILRDEDGNALSAQGIILDITDQVEAEQKASEMTHFPQSNPNPVLGINREGHILLANPAAEALLEEIGQGSRKTKSAWQELINQATLSAHNVCHELYLRDKIYLFNICPTPEYHKINLYGKEITQYRDNESRLSDIASDIPGAIWLYIVTPDNYHRINVLNDQCYQLWGISTDEIDDDPAILWRMVDKQDLSALSLSVEESVKKLQHWDVEYRIHNPDGKQKWLRSRGTPRLRENGEVHFHVVAMDLTAHKEAMLALTESYRKTIDILSATVEIRDPYTAGHEHRVASIAKKIGAVLNLEADQLMGLELAATIHDIGKISVPSDILNKPTKLTTLEFELIKQHPEAGANLLAQVEFQWPIADIIRQHHERIDGSGYPAGLKEDEILLEARIIAVADVIESMASHRPYRAALGVSAAAEEIQQGAGKIYDATVAEAALTLIAAGQLDL